jgi:hypothetical protein
MTIVAYNHGGEIHFHKAGCRDMDRGQNRFWSQDRQEFPNMDSAVSNFLDTGDESNPGWILEEMTFFPCTVSNLELGA